jgi:hypothetical protein
MARNPHDPLDVTQLPGDTAEEKLAGAAEEAAGIPSQAGRRQGPRTAAEKAASATAPKRERPEAARARTTAPAEDAGKPKGKSGGGKRAGGPGRKGRGR